MDGARNAIRLLDWKPGRKKNNLRDACENNIQTVGSYLIIFLITSRKTEGNKPVSKIKSG
jgi:hypothetical protein